MAAGRGWLTGGVPRYGPTGNCLTIESAAGRFARRRVNQPGIGAMVCPAGAFDNCCSMSTYFLTITGHA